MISAISTSKSIAESCYCLKLHAPQIWTLELAPGLVYI